MGAPCFPDSILVCFPEHVLVVGLLLVSEELVSEELRGLP